MRNMFDVTPGQTYRHYKGDYYLILHVGDYSDGEWEGKPAVVYLSLKPKDPGKAIHVRSLEGFLEFVEDQVARFTLVTGT